MESYRVLAEAALDRPVEAVDAHDAWILKGGIDAASVTSALTGRSFTAARRRGKLLLLDTSGDGPVLGVRFGMTGRLVVDGRAGVDKLIYSSDQGLALWDRFAVRFAGGGDLRLHDPRRLGGVFVDPDEDRLGVDVLTIGPAALRKALGRSAAPLKARLMDQSHLAGVGNLLADETLWRAGLDPRRPAGSLTPAEQRRLHTHLRASVEDLISRGGSHSGDLMPARARGGMCPRDGTPLLRDTVGGRTTFWCPKHQR